MKKKKLICVPNNDREKNVGFYFFCRKGKRNWRKKMSMYVTGKKGRKSKKIYIYDEIRKGK